MKAKALLVTCILLALGFCLAATSLSTAGIMAPTGFVQIIVSRGRPGHEQYVCSLTRQITFSDQGEGLIDWEDRHTTKPNRWQVLGTKIKGSAGSYLAYDSSGKDHRVFLSRETMQDGVGTDWTIRLMVNARQLHYHRIQAASGEMKGWDLDVEEYVEEDADGKTRDYRLVLRKGGRQSKVDIKNLLADRPLHEKDRE